MPSEARRRKRKRRSRLKRYGRKIITFLFSHVGLAAVSVAYMVAGAIVFKYIEAPHEMQVRTRMDAERSFMKHSWFLLIYHNFTKLDDDIISDDLHWHMENFKFALIDAIKHGYDGRWQLDNIQWSFSGAFFYSLTTISTVGYGNIACRTTLGRAITMLYAIFGIPLMLLFLAITGDTFSITCKFLYREYVRLRIRLIQWHHKRHQSKRVNSALQRLIREQLYHTAAMYGIIPPARVNEALLEEGQQDVKSVAVPIYVLMTIMTAYLVAGATLFCFWEDWDFDAAFYFCFVSLALIGFGDLFPGAAVIESWEARNKIIICALYLLVGMALIAMCFNLAQEDVIKMFHQCARRLGFSGEKKQKRDSISIDPRDIILEGGPIGGADETPPLTVRDLQGQILARVESNIARRQRLAQGLAKTVVSTPPGSGSSLNENSRLIMPNGNMAQMKRLHAKTVASIGDSMARQLRDCDSRNRTDVDSASVMSVSEK